MEFISFDIECCDSVHICEFGYVLFDEEFKILARECLTINPEHSFTVPFRQPGVDFTLAYAENIYRKSPTFPTLYPKIRSLLEKPGCRPLGFSLENDRSFLDKACNKYGLKKIKYNHVDFQPLYRFYAKCEKAPSVHGFIENLGIKNNLIYHKSDEDALAVYLGMKAIAERENIGTVSETIDFLKGKEPDFKIFLKQTKKENFKQKLASGNSKAQREYLSYFLEKTRLTKMPPPILFAVKAIVYRPHSLKIISTNLLL